MKKVDKGDSAHRLFASTGAVMVRIPLLPIDVLQPFRESPLGNQHAFSDPQEVWLAERAAITREWLAEVLTDSVVQESILIGSPDLFQAIHRWRQDPDSKRGRRAETNLFRYVVRMATRPTPFGLFAGVAMAHVSDDMNLGVGSLEAHRKYTRPDMQWLLYLVRDLEKRPEVADSLCFFTNSVSFVSGGRLFLPYVDSYGQAQPEKTVSLRATPVVLRTLALARSGATLQSLEQWLLNERPDATHEQVHGLLNGLCHQGALLSELRPPLTGEDDAVRYVLRKLEHIPGCEDVREQLQTTLCLTNNYTALPIGQGLAAFQKLRDAVEMPGANIRSTTEVDLSISLESCAFSASVVDEIARAAELMLRMSTAPQRFQHLSVYRNEFIERYGEGREVPLLEMLDEDVGLGPPPTYRYPPRINEAPVPPRPEYPLRDRTLLELAAAASRNRCREVVLDEDTLSRLAEENGNAVTPDSLDIYVSIAAQSQRAIREGDYSVVVGPRIGDIPGGRSFGRFCGLLGHSATETLRCIANGEQSRNPQRIFAELVDLPTSGHAANVVIRPAIRDYEIVVGATPGVPRAATIPVDDLVVGIQGDKFYVRSVLHNAEVVIRSTHLLNYMMAPNACRFLSEVSIEGLVPLIPFDWGPAAQMPFLPRIKVGRVVLCPARWRLPSDMIGKNKDRFTPITWYQRVQEWRRIWEVPRYIYMAEGDNRLLLDLLNPLSIADLREECEKHADGSGVVMAEEVLPGLDEVWVEGRGGRYIAEFVVPLMRKGDAATSEHSEFPGLYRSQRTPISMRDRIRLLGSDWLYAKLYCGQGRQDDLLAGPVRAFASQVIRDGLADDWFYIRYKDPAPHIRLRFQGKPQGLLAELMPALTSWSQKLVDNDSIYKLVLDSYEREIERYGGLEGMQIAEKIFAVDSMSVVDVLSLCSQKIVDIPSVDLTLMTTDALLSDLGMAAADRLNLYRAIRKEQDSQFRSQVERLRKTFHTYRLTAQRLIGSHEWLLDQDGGKNLEQSLRLQSARILPLGEHLKRVLTQNPDEMSYTSFLASCIHLHINRLLGINRPLEYEIIFYLERTLDSLQRHIPDGIQVR